ncbi:lipopolysaccharide biosynthesis protein [Enterococcus faecium]|uniref:lipopolysaccharide biosynthesis protein n=1 Tax=Enterococcus faecium TaxID=1352 RepID=UPI00288C7E1C|nr:oligosaccharide flippase family protein [Enterococcus faecium]MDT2300637.1 oligosaccharide flippase family protein [Enterococcus faecium]
MKIDKKYFKSLIVLFSGSLIAQGISVLFAPIMTRAFTAENLGIYTYLLSTATIFMPVINLRYDMSIVSVEEEDVIPIIKGSLIIGTGLSIFISIIYGIYIVFTRNTKLYTTIPFFFLLLISYSLINVFTAYNNKERNYKLISKVAILRSIFQNAVVSIVGLFYNEILTLLLFYSIGQFAGVREQAKSLKFRFKEIWKVPYNEVQKILKKEYKQPIYSTPAIFFNGLSYSLITILIEKLFDFSTVGFYSISVRMLGVPLALISGNVSRIFFERATFSYHNELNFKKEFKQTFILQLAISIPLTIFLLLFSPSLFSFFFGKTWEIAGRYVVILSPMFGIRFIVTTVSPALIIVGKQKLDLILQMLFMVAIITIYFIVKINNLDILSFLKLISLFFSIIYLGYLWCIYQFSKGE